MGWLGKIVGGTIGFALGGPLGAIAGAAFGHAFDQSSVSYDYGEVNRLSSNEETQLTFFVAAFSMLAKLTKVDGQITKEEIDSIEKFMVYDLNLSPESRRVAVNIFQTAIDSRESFQDFAAQFYKQFRYQPQILEFMIEILLRVSLADGALSEREEKLIRTATSMFNFSDQEYRQIKSRHVKDVEKFYAVLGSKSTDPDDQIKKQYRKLVMEYHPDTIASKGLPEEFIKFAEDKFREIHEAYEAIKKERGI
jgi:DnaJ like chaperone protein